MSGYKRVNFYELCRLCASNQQTEKTHIFQEEGRKIQLQTKIQSLLSLKVCEDDYLPKVVCSRCLQSLEDCYTFQAECVGSESMLSSYFNNYRYTEDFTKSGKVYIKDTPQKLEVNVPKIEVEGSNVGYTQDEKQPEIKIQPEASPPYIKQVKIPQTEALTINSSGEIMNFGSLIDIDSIMGGHMKKTKALPQVVKKLKQLDKPVVPPLPLPPPQQSPQEVFLDERLLNYNKPVKTKSVYMERNTTMPAATYQTTTFNTQRLIESITSAQKIVENFSTVNMQNCYITNYDQPEVVQEVAVSVDPLSTISTNWTDSITTPHLDPPPPKEHTPTKSAPKLYECEICKKTFKRREHLYQHVKLHTGFRPFTCENCNKSFMRKEHLLRHMTSHSGLKNFTCTVCDKSFSRNDNLLKHRKTHDKESNFSCDICNKQFVMKHYYIAHKLTHAPDTGAKSTVAWSIKT